MKPKRFLFYSTVEGVLNTSTIYIRSGLASYHAIPNHYNSPPLKTWFENRGMLTSRALFPPNCLPEYTSAVSHHLKHVQRAWKKSFPYRFWHGCQP